MGRDGAAHPENLWFHGYFRASLFILYKAGQEPRAPACNGGHTTMHLQELVCLPIDRVWDIQISAVQRGAVEHLL
jgi:hypothetical protein